MKFNVKKASQDFDISLIRQILAVAIFCLLPSQIFSQGGRVDPTFPDLLQESTITAMASQSDGKVIVAGYITTKGPIVRRDVIRLNTDGSLDSSFYAGSESHGTILYIKIQPDDKILLGGSFFRIHGASRYGLARLNSDGSLDTAFQVTGIDVFNVNSLDIQPDGKILIGANSQRLGSFIARLRPDGSNDFGPDIPLFSASGGSYYKVSYDHLRDKILAYGVPSYVIGGITYRGLARLNLNGTIDTSFRVDVEGGVLQSKVLASGKILIWGGLTSVNQVSRHRIALLNSDGSLDTSFVPATRGAKAIMDALVQEDGKIIIGEQSIQFGRPIRGNIARLNADGTEDTSFRVGRGALGDVHALFQIGENSLLVGGYFWRFDRFPKSSLVRLFM